MKKKIILTAIILMTCAAITYRMVNQVPSAAWGSDKQMEQLLTDGGCASCHTTNPKLPFYAKFPFVGSLVERDAADGYRSFDIEPMNRAVSSGKTVGEVDLAKVEKVFEEGTMPMAKYYLIHWGASMTEEKTAIALNWIKKHRQTHYPNRLAASEFANETIRPIEKTIAVDARKAALGEKLYHDTRLSIDQTVSCSTCHGLNTGGVDNKRFSEGVKGQVGGVNAPTVFNAHYNFVQFWDGRAATLAEQAGGPPLNPIEMGHASFDDICDVFAEDKAFETLFKEVYPEGFTQQSITDAIQEFERTLLTPDSKFDCYLKGDKAALTSEELHGYELFKQHRCATCHVGENLGGRSYELMGLKKDYFTDRGTEITIEDHGRYKETKEVRDMHRFKVPGLRNIALTYPYFHDGSKETLKEAVQDMAVYEVGKQLSEQESADIVAFLHTLTGKYNGQLLTNENTK